MSYYLNLSVLSNKHDNPRKAARQRLLSAEARHILSRYKGRPIAEEDIAREAAGRPFFPDNGMDFSISHSGSLAAVSLVNGGGKNPRTGCDVELVRPRARALAIAEEFFTAPEREYIESGGSFDITRFYQIWTLKECFLKLRGLSVFNMPGAPSFVFGEDPSQFALGGMAADFGQVSFSLYELSGSTDERYILATAIAGAEAKQPEIRWFSHEALDCRCTAKFVSDIVA
jgi:phosphopantetheinyl transferase (holo-ACP synthase)